jgi:RNA polymerase sigma-70 factor, ECF subfamily
VADARDFRLPELPREGADDTPREDVDSIAARLRAAVGRAVRRICPPWLAADADDLTQIATTRVLARLQQTPASGGLTSGYLYRAAHSALVDEIRRRRRLREEPMTDSEFASPQRAHDQQELRDALRACLAGLIAVRRRAVILHLQGHSAVEASELLGCGKKQVQNLIYRGLANLRDCLMARGVKP